MGVTPEVDYLPARRRLCAGAGAGAADRPAGRGQDALFVNYRGGRLTGRSVDRLVRRYVALTSTRLGISPQCGFSSAVVGNPVTVDDQIAKLRLVVDVAYEHWGSA